MERLSTTTNIYAVGEELCTTTSTNFNYLEHSPTTPAPATIFDSM
jgi:hypothetical protein